MSRNVILRFVTSKNAVSDVIRDRGLTVLCSRKLYGIKLIGNGVIAFLRLVWSTFLFALIPHLNFRLSVAGPRRLQFDTKCSHSAVSASPCFMSLSQVSTLLYFERKSCRLGFKLQGETLRNLVRWLWTFPMLCTAYYSTLRVEPLFPSEALVHCYRLHSDTS